MFGVLPHNNLFVLRPLFGPTLKLWTHLMAWAENTGPISSTSQNFEAIVEAQNLDPLSSLRAKVEAQFFLPGINSRPLAQIQAMGKMIAYLYLRLTESIQGHLGDPRGPHNTLYLGPKMSKMHKWTPFQPQMSEISKWTPF